jgi:lipopolysaccharide assembly outer membrane protein LptD (OstA)
MVLVCPIIVNAAAPEFKADKTYFDINTGLYVLEGNVLVRVKDAVIQAPRARVSLASLEVYAEGGISVTQEGICFRGNSVYVKGQERRAIIQGNITLETDAFRISCTTADFNWKTKEAVLKEAIIYQHDTEKHVDEAMYNVRTKTLRY